MGTCSISHPKENQDAIHKCPQSLSKGLTIKTGRHHVFISFKYLRFIKETILIPTRKKIVSLTCFFFIHTLKVEYKYNRI